jgi:hypothetical protein
MQPLNAKELSTTMSTAMVALTKVASAEAPLPLSSGPKISLNTLWNRGGLAVRLCVVNNGRLFVSARPLQTLSFTDVPLSSLEWIPHPAGLSPRTHLLPPPPYPTIVPSADLRAVTEIGLYVEKREFDGTVLHGEELQLDISAFQLHPVP